MKAWKYRRRVIAALCIYDKARHSYVRWESHLGKHGIVKSIRALRIMGHKMKVRKRGD